MWIDISRPIEPGALMHPEDPKPELSRYSDMASGDDYNLTQMRISLHTGTHFDAPLHFVKDGLSIDQFPLSRFDVRAYVVNLGDAAAARPEHFARLEVQRGDAILLRTTNEDLQRDKLAERWVYVTPEAAQWCVDHGVGILGVDYIEVENPEQEHGRYPVHEMLLPNGVLLLENLDLRGVEAGIYRLVCPPLRISGAEGAPCRAMLFDWNAGC